MNHLLFCLPLAALVTTVGQAQQLATLKAESHLSDMSGRTVTTARTHRFVVDAPLPLGGPNEEVNPIELLLGALSSCGVLVAEKVSKEKEILLIAAHATVEGDLDPRGVKGEPVSPHIQAFRLHLVLTGPTEEQAKVLTDAVKSRCPVYTTLAKAAPIELTVELVSK